MEQISDIEFRAEKVYKNLKSKFGYLIREVVSNAIHATMIKKNHEKKETYQPSIEVKINFDDNQQKGEIIIKDNGEGFNQVNSHYFSLIDKQNPNKQELNLHPMGQGRLSIVYFSDYAKYYSVYKDAELYKHKEFDYPPLNSQSSLFELDELEDDVIEKKDTETILTIQLTKQQTYNRARTFFNHYSDIEKLENWFIENFFPFFMNVKNLQLSLTYDNGSKIINRQSIENNIENISFSVDLNPVQEFILWLVKKSEKLKAKNQITCYARHLRAELDGGKIEYEIDLSDSYDWFLTSKYFDDRVDQKGDKIEISEDAVEKIQAALTNELDKHFASQIEENRKKSRNNYKDAKKKYKSLAQFMDEGQISSTNKILYQHDIVNAALDRKGKSERNYWLQEAIEDEGTEKLLNSSLYIYIEHRKRVLKKLEELVRRYDIDGEVKSELENEVHDMFLKRRENLNSSDNINHLHNLWLLDDKFTIFSETRQGQSTKNGQKASDIYLWTDDVRKPKELLILELKSTTHAHNAGSMVEQVKQYAADFYRNPEKIINWNVDTQNILYSGVILARKKDVKKELRFIEPTAKIPFLESSHIFDTSFSTAINDFDEPSWIKIRIEMYSYEDIFQLASDRNNVFFKLLDNEFKIDENEMVEGERC